MNDLSKYMMMFTTEVLKMSRLRSVGLMFIALFLQSNILTAQEGVADGVGKDKSKYAYLVCTKIPKGVENPVKMLNGRKMEEVVLSLRSSSMKVKLPSNGTFQLVKEVPGAVGTPEVGKGLQVIAQAQIPEGVRQAIIILVPSSDPDSKKEGIVFDTYVQDIAKFKGGASMYVNLTGMPIGVQLGKIKKNVKPGSSLIMDTGVTNKPENFPVSYWQYEADGKSWQRISSSTIAFYPTRREICFFYPKSKGKIGYRGVTCPVEN